MSASTIARWNAISMNPQQADNDHTLKRARPEDDGSDDDISIVSRSPSPSLDQMDVDTGFYDDRRRAPEAITVETRIKPENKGFALLAKMGWSEGQPLGLSADGRVDPIPFQLKNDSTGIGKITQDVRMIETTVSQRRGLDSERQQKETEDQRNARQELAARKSALENEISTTLRPFYCEICDKQFKNVAQYDEHTNSYAHHHKARLRDVHVNARPTPKDELDKRKEKERRREEKELRKIAAANGIKMAKPLVLPPTQSASSSAPPVPASVPSHDTGMEVHTAPSEPKKGGWAAVSSSTPQSGFKKPSWSTVAPPLPHPQTVVNSWPSASMGAQPSLPAFPQPHTSSEAPTFRNAGWASLETSNSQVMAPAMPPDRPIETLSVSLAPPPSEFQTPPAPPLRPIGAGWKQFQSSMKGKNRQ